MKYIAILVAQVFILKLAECCSNYPNGLHCSYVSNEYITVSDKNYISIDNGEIQMDSDFVEKFPAATFLNLEDSSIYVHNADVKKGHSLKSLWIIQSEVDNFIGVLKWFRDLEELKISYTIIDYEVVDKELLKNSKNLKVLKLNHVKINTIAENAFDNLSNLNYIEITGTDLHELPGNLLQFNMNVEYLILSKSKFTTIPDMKYPQSLRTLSLYHNLITNISKNDLRNLVNLEDLLLNSNMIEEIDENAFEDLRNIKYLQLASNQLKSFSRKLFDGLESLDFLDLSYNYINENDLDALSDSFAIIYPQKVSNVDYSLDSDEYQGNFQSSENEGSVKNSTEDEELKDMYYAEVFGSGEEDIDDDTSFKPNKNFESDDEDDNDNGSGSGIGSLTTEGIDITREETKSCGFTMMCEKGLFSLLLVSFAILYCY